MSSPAPAVDMRGITVRYPGQVALAAVDLRLLRGEIHSVMGENGAGKSTLLKVLTGAVRPDEGVIEVAGRPVSFSSPADAAAHGVGVVYQELNLLPNLSVAENVLLGREPRNRFGIDWKRMRTETEVALERLGLDVDPRSLLRDHVPAVRQLIGIARALTVAPSVLVLDEPTSSLDEDEVERLFGLLRQLRGDGVAIVFVSHFLEQVYEIADRLTVLRGGRLIGEFPTREILRRDLVTKMLGRDPGELAALGDRQRDEGTPSRALLSAKGVGRGRALKPFDLEVFEGEVIGFAGLLGSGRSEVARTLSGVDQIDLGTIEVDGHRTRLDSPRTAIRRRVVYSSEDRREEGIIGELSVRDNIVLALQAQRGWFRRLPTARQDELVASYIEALHISPVLPDTLVARLSGGNQQKVLLARWLALAPRILILDEPTRGIDVGAKVEIQRLVASLVENGLSVLYISAELDEVLRLSDRVAIMRDHELVAVVPGDELTREELLSIIAEGRSDGPR